MLPKIMIIDDEENICKALGNFLDDFEEFDIRTAHSAEEALRALDASPADICIVDLRLPGMNGIELVRNIVTRGLCRRNILHTASLDFELTDDLASLGVTDEDIFFKPTQNTLIFERIRSVLALPRSTDGAP